jgi:transketolase
LSFTEDVLKRFEAYGWHTQSVKDVTGSLDDLRAAIKNAQTETTKPSIIKVKTTIGYGSLNQGHHTTHGAPLGDADISQLKKKFGLPEDKFYVDASVRDVYAKAAAAGDEKRKAWEDMFANYTKAHAEKAQEISRRFAGKLPDGIFDKLPVFNFAKDKDTATRRASQMVLEAIGPSLPEFVGGSADLTGSNLTHFKEMTVDYQKDTPIGRYIRFGVREHGMTAICNGMFAHGGLR